MQGSTVAGIVEKVESNTLRLKDPIVGRTITVQLATNVKILEQAAVQPSEIQQGVHVSVWGKQQGSVYQAEAVQIGAAGALGGGPATIGSHGGEGTATNELTTNSDAPVVPGVLMGIVEQVDGTQLLVKSSDGKTTTVQLLNDVQVGKQKEFGVEALDPGKFAICKGTQTGNTFEATQIELLPPPGAP